MVVLLYAKVRKYNHDDLLNKYLNLLPPESRKNILRFRRWQDVQLSLLGKLLLKEGMSYFDQKVDFSNLRYTTFKKPYFLNGKIQFNISHSSEVVVCVLTDFCTKIGIDVERIEKIDIKSFQFQMTNFEYDTIINGDNIEASFYKYWTQKEAIIKADGRGLNIPLKSFEVIQNKAEIDTEQYFTYEVPFLKQYSCYIAANKNILSSEVKIEKMEF